MKFSQNCTRDIILFSCLFSFQLLTRRRLRTNANPNLSRRLMLDSGEELLSGAGNITQKVPPTHIYTTLFSSFLEGTTQHDKCNPYTTPPTRVHTLPKVSPLTHGTFDEKDNILSFHKRDNFTKYELFNPLPLLNTESMERIPCNSSTVSKMFYC